MLKPEPEIIIGCPGCGKTHALLSIVDEELARGTPPEVIGFVSFTRRAAREAVERAVEKFGLDKRRFPYFRTLHSLCYRQLGLSSGDVLEGKRMQEFADWAGVRLTGRLRWEEGSTFGSEPGDRILHMENLARVRCRPLAEQYNEDDDNLPWNEVQRVVACLEHFKRKRHLIDYTDMLSLWAQSSATTRCEVLLVDEAQDLSLLQWRVVERLAATCRRVVVAGDDDQAIYHWAGAALEHFVALPGTVRVLGVSWRVPQSVQTIALDIIGRVSHRRPKVWSPRTAAGVVDRYGLFEDVDADGPDVLVLARNSFVLRDLVEPALRQEGVIYERGGVSSVPQDILQAIVHWERLRRGETVSAAAVRGVYGWTSAVLRGHRTLPGVADDKQLGMGDLHTQHGLQTGVIWHDALNRIPPDTLSYILAARRRGERLASPPRVRLSTIHSAKGGQAAHVVLMLDQAKRTAEEAWESPEDEARVWYVGVTRAQERLSIVGGQSQWSFVL